MSAIVTRRQFSISGTTGLGGLAFAALSSMQAKAEKIDPLSKKKPHFEPRAKRVIFLSMRGAPSHVDTFDYKPQLTKDDGKSAKYGAGNLLGSPWAFAQRGKSGLWMSDLFPYLSTHADKLCMLHGMHTDEPNHPGATRKIHTGSGQFVRPSLGAWSLYGLGTENANLPGFICLGGGGGDKQNCGNAFLPAIYQGTLLGSGGPNGGRGAGGSSIEFPNIKNPNLSAADQRKQLDFIQKLNRDKLARDRVQPQIEGVIQSYELAFRMQVTMPELLDLSNETEATKKLYGIGEGVSDNFGSQCLLARRMVEKGVRFVEVVSNGWDHHRDLKNEMEDHCAQIDQPIAGLLTDLAQRGLLKDTLVIWAGEFGRTPHGQGGNGRDHNSAGFTTWLAGGGVKAGFAHGATDDYGYAAVDGRTSVHDWHATILHLIGLDHEKLTYNYGGRDFRLTDVHGNVVDEILA